MLLKKDYYSIGDFSKLTKITQRTLRYYDEKNLLKPSYVSESGRRYYTEEDMIPLQQIIAFKYLGFNLEEIYSLLNQSNKTMKGSLEFQKKLLIEKQEHLSRMIKATEHAIDVLEEEKIINTEVLAFLIHSIKNEQEHLDWVGQYLPDKISNHIFKLYEEKESEINRKTTILFQKLKEKIKEHHYRDDVVQQLIEEMLQLLKEVLGEEVNIDLLSSLNIEDDSAIFYSPFTKEEEEMIGKAFEYYFDKKGENI